jgi:hypothetical protein
MNKTNILIESEFIKLFYLEKHKIESDNLLKKEVFDKIHCLFKSNTTANFNRFIDKDLSSSSDDYLKHLAIKFFKIDDFELKKKEFGCVVFTTNDKKEYKKTHNQLIISIEDLKNIGNNRDQIGIEKYFLSDLIYVKKNSKLSDIYDYKFHFSDLLIIDGYLLEKCENSDEVKKVLYKNTIALIYKLFKIKNNQKLKLYLNFKIKSCIDNSKKLFEECFFNINSFKENDNINFEAELKDIHNRNILSDFLIATSEHGFNLFREKNKVWASIITIIPIFHYNNRKNLFEFFDLKKDIVS